MRNNTWRTRSPARPAPRPPRERLEPRQIRFGRTMLLDALTVRHDRAHGVREMVRKPVRRADLPMPGSPEMNASCRWPATARSAVVKSHANSSCRPTNTPGGTSKRSVGVAVTAPGENPRRSIAVTGATNR